MATTERLGWLRNIVELANAATVPGDADDIGPVIAAALVVAAAADDSGVLEATGSQDGVEVLAAIRAAVRETGELPKEATQALILACVVLAAQGKLGDPEEFVRKVAALLDQWGV